MRNNLDILEPDALLHQNGTELRRTLIIREHHAFADKITRMMDIALLQADHDVRRMLEDGCDCHDRFARDMRQQNIGIADTVASGACEHLLHRRLVHATFNQLDIQILIAIKTLDLGGVIAGELKLVMPFELNADMFRAMLGKGSADREKAEKNPEHQPHWKIAVCGAGKKGPKRAVHLMTPKSWEWSVAQDSSSPNAQ